MHRQHHKPAFDHRRHALAINLLLTVALPVLAGCLFWLAADFTITAHDCANGSGGSLAALCAFLIPIALTPTGVVLHARLTKLKTSYAVVHATTTLAIALVGIYVESWFWWSAHNCMT